jgi:predicted O-methyltransferase YrrM
MEHFFHKIQGWFSFANLYSKVVADLPSGSHIVEVGAWKGRSTAYLAVEIVNSGKNIKLDVVDIWTGSENDPTAFHTDEEFVKCNRNIFELFKKNIAPVKHIVNPIQLPSVEAAKAYADQSVDFVLIDAEHTYAEVKKDILAWLPKVKNGGIIAGDDYNPASFPGVIKAVHEIFTNDQISFMDSCWVVKVKL